MASSASASASGELGAFGAIVGAVRALALWLGLADAACWETLAVRLEVLDRACLSAFVSRGLGLAIIAGACVVKLPQLHKIVVGGHAPDANSVYLETLSSVLAVVWFSATGVALSEYGENIVLAAANVLVVLAVWRLRFPGAQHVALVLALAAAATAAAVAATGAGAGAGAGGAAALANAAPLLALQCSFNGIFEVGRVLQILAIVRDGRRAAEGLALISLLLQFAGTAARVFTTWQKVPDALQLFFAGANCALNAAVLAQYLALVTFAAAPPPKTKQVAEAAAEAAKGGAAASPESPRAASVRRRNTAGGAK